MKKIISVTLFIVLAVMWTTTFANSERDKQFEVAYEGGIEENQEVAICTTPPYEKDVTLMEDKAMLPLRETLEYFGYDVIWNGQSQSVEIKKGAQWTAIQINKNAYFKNKMASHKLSSAPKIFEDKAYVPVEFFTDVLGLSLSLDQGRVKVEEGMVATVSGSIKELGMTDGKIDSITLTSDMDTEDIGNLTVVHISSVNTIINTSLEVGKKVEVITAPIMTMSLPPQRLGYVIY
jgi:hypothetical protein